MTDEFESLRGEVLMESDARKMLIRATALGIILAGNKLNSAARNRFLKYCDESTLDLFVEDKPETLENIEQIILKSSKETPINISTDKNSKFESLVQVLDMLKKHAYSNVSIVTKK